MAISELQVSVGDQKVSEFHQKYICDNAQVKQDKMDALKLKKYTFQVKKVPKNVFSQSFEVLTIVPSIGMARESRIH